MDTIYHYLFYHETEVKKTFSHVKEENGSSNFRGSVARCSGITIFQRKRLLNVKRYMDTTLRPVVNLYTLAGASKSYLDETIQLIADTAAEKTYPKQLKIPVVCHRYRNSTDPQKSLKSVDKTRIDARQDFKLNARHGFLAEEELGGKLRFSADGFANREECQILLDLSLNRGVTGDGYEGNESPHSEMEHFEGISLWRLAEMVKSDEVDASVMELFMEICERGKNITECYFGEQGKFHFAFSQIACRTGITEKTKDTDWMSHKIHADNCQLQPSGECLKEEPAYTSNDYSAIIYLNDNFEGGKFVFSEDPFGEVIQSMITPKCGRIVGFTAGPENKHGVQGVTRGTRCALGLWFTKDPAFSERRPFLMETIEEIRLRSKRKTRNDT